MCRDTNDPESAWSSLGEGGGLGVVVAVESRSTRMRTAESCSWSEATCLVRLMMTERYAHAALRALAAQEFEGVRKHGIKSPSGTKSNSKHRRLLPVDCHGPWGSASTRREDASPLRSLLGSFLHLSWCAFRSYASTEIGPREHARARSPGVTHSSPPQKVARSPTRPIGARSRSCTRSR